MAVACVAAAATVASADIIIILGPATPKAHSTRGMHMRITPHTGDAGTEFKAVASGFAHGEYVAVWEYYKLDGKNHSTQLNGGTANGKGRLAIYPQTATGVSVAGTRKLCAQGQRTKRVACGSFRIKDAPDSQQGGSDQTGGGYTPPSSDGGYTPPSTGPGYVPPGSG